MSNTGIPEMNLKDIAEQAKAGYRIDEIRDNNVQIVNELQTPTESQEYDDDAPVIHISGIPTEKISPLNSMDIAMENNPFAISDADLKEVMPDLSELSYKQESETLRTSIEGYRKNLLINGGLTIEEVNEAAKNRLINKGKEINDTYLVSNPKVGIVEIDKKNVDKVEFSEEEKAKLTKSKAIRLIAVEDIELQMIQVEKVDKKTKASYLRTIEGTLSKYSLPLPILGDYVTFRGAQIIQLIGTVKYEDEAFDETINKKASLIYDRLIGGTIFNKYDDSNKIIMSYQDFANKFKYHDIDMGLFGILVASSMEEVESQLTCSHCQTPFQWKYNLKTILKLDGISDKFKKTFDSILGDKFNDNTLTQIHNNYDKALRLKSPFTQNVYEIAYPTVARSTDIYKVIDQKDPTMVYLSSIGIFLNSIYIYNAKSGKHVHIENGEIRLMMENLQTIPQQDLDMLLLQIKEMIYEPEFKLPSQCPACGHNMVNTLSIDDLVFLRAQDTSTEIRL